MFQMTRSLSLSLSPRFWRRQMNLMVKDEAAGLNKIFGVGQTHPNRLTAAIRLEQRRLELRVVVLEVRNVQQLGIRIKSLNIRVTVHTQRIIQARQATGRVVLLMTGSATRLV